MSRIAKGALGALCFVLSLPAAAQSVGPDVIVGDLYDLASHGSSGGTYAYSVGTISCNIGNVPLQWVSSTNQHPVIGCALYRVKNGRFEQLGLSWLKHGFLALTGSVCASCQNPGTGALLGVNCSDPYSASLNGSASNLGPRFEVNPFTGNFNYPYAYGPTGASVIAGRINVAGADVDPALNAGAIYFVEGQYVTPDDAAAGNQFNNASYRRVAVGSDANRSLSLLAATVRQKHAMYAWKEVDPSVSLKELDVPGEGRFLVGYKVVALGGGLYRHEYAVQNCNSDRAGGSFSLALPAGATATNLAFKDVAYHSGEPQGGTDWTSAVVTGSSVTWTCTTAPPLTSANALRWGTTYNFGFDSTAGWLPDVTIGLWKPGVPGSISGTICRAPTATGAPVAGGTNYVMTSVPYDFVDASTGTNGPTGDDNSTTVTLPFPFTFYGVTLTQLVVSTNGYVAAPGQPGNVFSNVAIPTSGTPNHFIAPYWDDLEVAGGGGAATGWCRTLTTGVAPNRRFVIHWNDAERYQTANKISFQIILDEGTNAITTTMISTSVGATGGSATAGIEDAAGALGVQQFLNNAAGAVAGTSVRYTFTPPVWGPSADLALSGDGSNAVPFRWDVTSNVTGAPVTLFVDIAPGPIDIPGFGRLELALSPSMLALADGTGAFGPFTPTAITDACNAWSMSLAVSPTPVPPALIDVYFQALVWGPGAPNGLVHLTNLATY
jgi:hypothetical protein